MAERFGIAVFLVVSLAAACGPGDFGDPREGWRVELIEADRAFARATAERGVDGWTEWFDAEGTMIRGTGEIVGRSDIRAAMAPLLSDSTIRFRWTPTRAVVSESGDLGFTLGPYEVVAADPAPGEEAVRSRGMYLTVWRRQADGSWRVVTDIGSPAG